MATILFGDSIAKGITYQDSKLMMTSNPIVESIKNLYGIEIDNRSVYGQTLKRIHEKNLIKSAIETLDLNKKHYVVIAVGGNDADYDWKKIALDPDYRHQPKTPLVLFEKLLTENVIYLKEKGITPILLTSVPLISKRYYDEVISHVGNTDNIMKFFNQDIEMIFRHHEAYSHVIMMIAFTYDCLLIDIRTSLLHQDNYNDYLSNDGIHPNQKGYDLIRSIIDEKMKSDEGLMRWKRDSIEESV